MKNYLSIFMAGLIAGSIATFMWQKPTKISEVAMPEQRHDDGSVTLARDPNAPKIDAPKPAQGGKAVREISVTVQPDRNDCPTCTVNLTLSRLKDGTHRVDASTPTGRIVSGIDIPVEPAVVPASHPWAAGITYGTDKGIFIDRDIGMLRIGVEASRGDSTEARVRLGVRF